MRYLLGVVFGVILASCGEVSNKHQLPFFGHNIFEEEDTVFYTVGNYELVNQNGDTVTEASYENQITITDFFFTTCPTICPIMKAEMLRVYEAIEEKNDVKIVSFTIDPEHDSVAVLNQFAQNLGVKSDKWQFLTGEKDSIYSLAQTFLVLADQDPSAPGGFIHSGAFILLDKERRIRGLYDGTVGAEVDLLINDIDILRKEYE